MTSIDASEALPQVAEASSGHAGDFIVPETLHPAVLRFARRIVRVRELVRKDMLSHVPVAPAEAALENHCFQNVEQHVREHGGKLCHGWAIWEWPGVLLQAEFHAVWESEEGRKLDVTPRAHPARQILFLRDPERRYEGRRVESIMEALYQDELVEDYVELCRRCFSLFAKPDGGEVSTEGVAITCTGGLAEGMLRSGGLAADPCACGSGRKYLNCHHLVARKLILGRRN